MVFKTDGVQFSNSPSVSGEKPIQTALMPSIQRIIGNVHDVLLAFLTQEKTIHVCLEMIPLGFRKTTLIIFKCCTKNINIFRKEHYPILRGME